MAYGTTRTQMVVDKELDEEVRRKKALEDLNHINKSIDEARAEAGLIVSKQNELKELDSQIKEKIDTLEALTSRAYETEQAGKNLERIESRIGELDKQDEVLGALVSEKKQNIADLSTAILGLEDQKVSKGVDIEGLNKKIADKNRELVSMGVFLKDRIGSAERILKTVEDAKISTDDEILENKKIIANLTQMAADIKLEVEAAERTLSSVDAQIKEKEAIITNLNLAFEKQKADQKEFLASRESDLTAREGAASDKESWLSDKELKLRKYKGQLEDFYGKKIDTIVI
jgi:predicted  nucleic acid-binding Zn-ribbon protein